MWTVCDIVGWDAEGSTALLRVLHLLGLEGVAEFGGNNIL
jgi:hypothetical protein